MFKSALQTSTELIVESLDRLLQRLTNISYNNYIIMLSVEETDHTTSRSLPYPLQ